MGARRHIDGLAREASAAVQLSADLPAACSSRQICRLDRLNFSIERSRGLVVDPSLTLPRYRVEPRCYGRPSGQGPPGVPALHRHAPYSRPPILRSGVTIAGVSFAGGPEQAVPVVGIDGYQHPCNNVLCGYFVADEALESAADERLLELVKLAGRSCPTLAVE